MQSLEDMFFDYLNENNLTIANYNYFDWMKHFKTVARYRTLCFDCLEVLQNYHRKEQKKVRIAALIKEREEKEAREFEELDDTEKKQRQRYVQSRSERAVEVIRWWICTARYSFRRAKDVKERRARLQAEEEQRRLEAENSRSFSISSHASRHDHRAQRSSGGSSTAKKDATQSLASRARSN